jgi:hypothetical protein
VRGHAAGGFSLADENARDTIRALIRRSLRTGAHVVVAEQKQDTGPGLAGFFKDLVRSFAPAGYPELAGRPASSSAVYLAGVLFFVTLALTPLFYTGIEQALRTQQAYIEEAYPEDLYFEGGHAIYEGKQPYVYRETIEGVRGALVVDTTGTTTKLPEEYEIGRLITKDKIIDTARPADGPEETAENPIPTTEGRVSARQLFLDAVERSKWPRFLFGLGTLFMFGLLMLFAVVAIAAGIGFGAEWLRKGERPGFGTCFGIASHAGTPLAFIPAGAMLAPAAIWFYLLVGVPLALFVLLLVAGTQACRVASSAADEAERTEHRKHKAR